VGGIQIIFKFPAWRNKKNSAKGKRKKDAKDRKQKRIRGSAKGNAVGSFFNSWGKKSVKEDGPNQGDDLSKEETRRRDQKIQKARSRGEEGVRRA